MNIKQAFDLGKQLFALKRDTDKNTADIKELREEIVAIRQDMRQFERDITDLRIGFVELTRVVERLATELQHERERATTERRNQQLELENTLLRLR